MNNICRVIFLIVLTLSLLTLTIYNLITNEKFLESSLATCVSIGVVIYISYYLTQKQNDKRKQKEILLNLLESIQNFAMDKTSYAIDSEDAAKAIITRKRLVSNRINLLVNYSNKLNIKEESSFISQKFREYEDFLGEHFNDLDSLRKSEKELRRPLELIDIKLSEIMLKLFE